MTDNSQPQTKEELLSLIAREWDLLLAFIAKLDEKQMSTSDAGGWTPKDNLAHIAEWLNILLGYHMDKRPAHEVLEVSPEVTENWDFDRINQVLLERNRDRSVEDVLGWLKNLYNITLKRLEAIPFEELTRPRPQGSMLLESVIGDTYEHFAEHRENIEKALKD